MQEKLDHLGIVALIVGTPITQSMALLPGADLAVMYGSCLALLAVAFLRPLLRTLGFLGIGAVMVVRYYYIVNLNLGLQIVLYVAGAVSFVR